MLTKSFIPSNKSAPLTVLDSLLVSAIERFERRIVSRGDKKAKNNNLIKYFFIIITTSLIMFYELFKWNIKWIFILSSENILAKNGYSFTWFNITPFKSPLMMRDKGWFETRPYILPPFYCPSLQGGRLCQGDSCFIIIYCASLES